MKKWYGIFCCAVLASGISLSAAPLSAEKGNLLKKLVPIPNAAATEITEEEIICDNGTQGNLANGVAEAIWFAQPLTTPLFFSAESKCEGLSSKPNHNYAIYVDAQYTDGSMEYGILGKWKTGTHGWEKVSTVFVPKKPVKTIWFHLLFRSQTGLASFRDALIRPATAEEVAATK